MAATATARTQRGRVVLLSAVLLAAVVGLAIALTANVRPQPSPLHTADLYLAAVQRGDRAALEGLVPATSADREAMLARHEHPSIVASMTFKATPSSGWWDLTMAYDDQPAEHLWVRPRPGLAPGDAQDWVVEAAR